MQKQQISESQTKATKVNQGKTLKRLASFALGIGGVAITAFLLILNPIGRGYIKLAIFEPMIIR